MAARSPEVERTLPWRRMSSFVSLPLISLVGSVLLIPVIASASGARGWAAVALGQAVGTGAGIVLQYGWGFLGPTRLVPLPAEGRACLLWVSLLSKLVVAAVLLPPTALVAAALAPHGQQVLAALTAIALATFGFSSFWFFVGTGRPGQAARYETIPRLVVLLVAAGAVLATGNALWYPVVFLAGQLLGVAAVAVRLADVSLSRATWGAALRALVDQRAAAATDVVFAGLQALPTSILAGVAPGSLAVFAAGDRVQRLGQSGIQPVFNAFQGWVSDVPPHETTARMRLAVATTSAWGLLAGTALAVGLPLVDRVLFAGEVEVGYGVSIPSGIALALYALTSSLNFNVLAPSNRPEVILRSTLACALVAVAGVASLPQHLGAAGGALALAAAQVAALAVQLPAWARITRARTGLPAAPDLEHHLV
jgi:O-antigen/teichoic acid export membrane protein